MTDEQPTAYEVPFVELLESVPNNSRLWVDFPEGMGSTHFPVGHYCHKAAVELRRLHEENETLRARLAQPEPEPVAWHEPGAYGNVTVHKKWAEENGWLPLYEKEHE